MTNETVNVTQTATLAPGGDLDGDGVIDPGDTMLFTVTITNNSTSPGPMDAFGVQFSEILTGLTPTGTINISPIAFSDSFTAVGNTLLEVGNATSQTGIQVSVAGSVTANDVEFFGDGFTISLVNATAPVAGFATITTANGATVVMDTQGADIGSFTYVSGAGFEGTDTFTYTIRDDGLDGLAGNADDLVSTATVTINVGTSVWYVDPSAAPGGNGTSTNPFQTVAPLTTGGSSDGLDDAGDYIHVKGSSAGTLVLEGTQHLIGTGTALVVDGFTLTAASTNSTLTGASGFTVTLGSGNQVSGINIGGVGGISGTGFGTVTVDDVNINTSGQALSLTTGAVAGSGFDNTTSTGGTSNVSLTGITGTLALGTGALSGSTGDGFVVSGGTAAVTYGGSITKSTGSEIVDISGHSIGNITLSGAINSSGASGIRLVENASGTIAFTNAAVNLNTGANAGLTFTNTGSTGATVNFTGGNLNIDTANGIGINATSTTIGAGSLTISGSNNVVDKTGSANGAIFLNGVTSNVNLLHVNSTSSTTGVGSTIIYVKDNGATGSFEITGDNASGNGTGGILNGSAGADGSTTTGIGVYLENANNVVLEDMTFNGIYENYGIYGINVNNFTLRDSLLTGTRYGSTDAGPGAEAAVKFGVQTGTTGLIGTALFEGNTIQNGLADNLAVYSFGSGLPALVLTIRDNPAVGGQQAIFNANHAGNGNDSVHIETGGSRSATINITGVQFTGARGDHLQIAAVENAVQNITISGNTFTQSMAGAAGGGMRIGGGGTGSYNVTYNVNNNTMTGATDTAIGASYGGTGAIVNGIIQNNTIGTNGGGYQTGLTQVGSLNGIGINVGFDKNNGGTGSYAVRIEGNTIRDVGAVNGGGIVVSSSATSNSGVTRVEATVLNNSVADMGPASRSAFMARVGGQGSTDNAMLGLNLQNNVFTAGTDNAVYLDQISAVGRFYVPGYGGSGNGELTIHGPTGTASDGLTKFWANAASVPFVAGSTGNNTLTNGGPIISMPGKTVWAGEVFGLTGNNFVLAVPMSPLRPDLLESDATGGEFATPGPDNQASQLFLVDVTQLDQGELTLVAEVAIQLWADAGASAEQLAAMRALTVVTANLPGFLGYYHTPGELIVDFSNAGHGWAAENLLGVLLEQLGSAAGISGPLPEARLEPQSTTAITPVDPASSVAPVAPGTEAPAPSLGGTPTEPAAIPPTIANGTQTANIGTLPAGQTVVIQFTATVDPQTNQLIVNPQNTGTVTATNSPGFPDTPTNPVTTTLDTLTLGGTIWNDSGAGGGIKSNGIRDGAEAGVAGVAVSLFVDANDDNVPDTPGTAIATTLTNASGNYSFTGLAPGNYIVRVDQDNFDAGGNVSLLALQASPLTVPEPIDPDNNVDNDDNGARVLGQAAFSNAITLAYNTEPTNGTGNDTNNTLDFSFVAPNQAPTSTNLANDSVTWIEGQALPTLLDLGGNATLADVDSPNFDTGTLTISIAGALAEDGLFIGTVGTVTTGAGTVSVGGTQIGTFTGGGYGGGPLVITFDADATPAAVQELARAIQYNNNAGDEPTDFNRTITWTLVDGDGTANGGQDTLVITTTVDVDPVNDAPQGTDSTITMIEDGTRTLTAADFGFSDPLDNDAFAGVVLTALPANGDLYLDGSLITVAGTFVTAAQLGANQLAFRPDPNGNGTGYSSFNFQVRDNGGTLDGGLNTDPSANTLTFNLDAVNDAPVVTFAAMPEAAPGDPLGEKKVNTFVANAQNDPAVAALVGGGHVVVWASSNQDGGGFGVYAQRYDASGVAQGLETQVNTQTASNQIEPDVAGLGDGSYVVIWSGVGTGDIDGVFMQRYSAAGVAQGVETLINSVTTGSQHSPAVAALADGGYVIVWQSNGQDGSGSGIFGQRFNSTGVAQGPEFPVNTVTAGGQQYPSVTALAGGGFAIAWFSDHEGSGQGVYVRRFDALGVGQGNEVRANSFTANDQSYPSIGTLTDGGYVVAWESLNQDGSAYGIYAQRYSATGAPVGVEFRANTATANIQDLPTIAGLADGGFVITWRSFAQDGGGFGVYSQRYNAAGAPVGGESLVNNTLTGAQLNPDVAALPGSGYLITWEGNGSGDSSGVFTQRYSTAYTATEQVALSLKGRITVSDVDADAAIVTATVSVGYGVLDVTLGGSGANIVSGNGTGTVVLSGTIAQLNALLNSDATSVVTFTANTDSPPSSTALTVTVNDGGATGADPGLTGDGDDEQGSATTTINILSVNDAPSGADKTVEASEDDPYIFTAADFGFTDPIDGDDFAGVVLTTLPADGDLRLNGVNITVAGTFISAADIAAGLLTFLADPDDFGDNYASFTFQVRDDGGILNGGVDTDQSANTITIDVEPDNIAPVLDLNGAAAGDGSTATVTEQSGGATLAPDLVVTDVDDTNLEGATVQITANLQAADLLSVAGAPNGSSGTISWTYTAATGTLAFTGSASLADYQALLRQVTLEANGDDVGTSRTVTWTVTDGDGDSNMPTTAVTVIGENDPPTLTGTGGTPTFTEGGAAVDLYSGVFSQTYEANQTITSLTLTVSNVTEGNSEVLVIDGSDVALGNGNMVVTAGNGLIVNVSVTGTTATVSFSGAALTPAAIAAIVDAMTYRNLSDAPTDANRVITITQIVDSGANGGNDVNNSNPNLVATVNVDPVNDPAMITGDATGAVTEAGGVANGSAGVPTDTGDLDATDVDNTPQDDWQTVSNGTTTSNYGTYSLSATGVWTYTLDNNNASVQALNGLATLTDTFTALTADGTAQIVTITISAQNDAAVITGDSTGSVTEAGGVANGTPGIPTDTGDLDAADVDNPADAWAAVAAGTVSASGYGTYELSAAGVWVYTLDNNNAAVQALLGSGTLNDSFTALTADGTAQVVTITIGGDFDSPQLDLNGAGAGTSASLAYTENDAVAAIAPAGTVADVDTTNFNGARLIVRITNGLNGEDVLSVINQGTGAGQVGYSNGSITYEGVQVATLLPVIGAPVPTLDIQFDAGTISQAAVQAVLRAIGYSNSSEEPSTTTRNLSFELSDGEGPTPVTAAATITLTSVNDEPTSANVTINGVSEDDPYTFQTSDFPFSDSDGDAPFAVVFVSLPMDGDILLNGAAILMGDAIAYSAIAAGMLTFQPDPDEFGSPYTSFTFRVQDDGGTAAGGDDLSALYTATINVTPDNLPPAVDLDGGAAGVDASVSYTENAAGIAIGSGIAVTDPNSGIGDQIEGAVVTLTDAVAGDVLSIAGALPAGIGAVITNPAGQIVVTLSGGASQADYATALGQIRYSSTSDNPTAGGDTTRTITVTVSDGDVSSAVATSTVTITPVDDASVAQDDDIVTDEGTPVSGNLFANNGHGPDTDPDSTPVIATIDGAAFTFGVPFALLSGALLTVNADGTFEYDPNGRFDPTPTPGSGASNQPAGDSFTYELVGGSSATVTITIDGLDTDDLLLGTSGSDMLFAGVGADTLVGLGGSDFMDGGSGIDTATFSGALSFVDTAIGWVVQSGEGTDVLQNVEIAVEGSGQRNLLVGSTGFANVQAAFNAAEAGDIVRLAGGAHNGAASYADAGLTVLAQAGAVLNLAMTTGTGFGISVYGGASADDITTGDGNDLIVGGDGDDVTAGGNGNDAYIVEQAGDVVNEGSSGGYDTVYALTSYELGVNQEIEVLTVYDRDTANMINLTGNNLANTIYGNQGTNLIIGGGGDDIMFGLGGNDSYIVEQAGDEVIEGAGGGFDTVYTLTSYDLATDQAVETLTVYDRSTMNALDLGGNNLDNTIYGNAGTNMIAGRGGNDSLYGMGGADIFKFTTAPGAGNVDAIMDFGDDDTIALDADAFLGIGGFGTLDEDAFVTGTSAEDAEDRIIYDEMTGRLWFDADGNGDGVAILFATLADNPILTASDFTVI